MKQLLVINDPRLAQSLVDFLSSRGMHCELTQSEVGITVWLVDETRSTEAETEVKRFIKEPYHPRYAEASWQSGTPNSRIDYNAGQHSLSAHLLIHAGPVTLVVIVACISLFLLNLMFTGLDLYGFLSFHADLASLTGWQIWRFVTPALLHFSALHLIFNLMWWWYLGGMIERQAGSSKLLMLFLVGAAIPNLVEFLVTGPDFGGLSGVVYVLVAYVWLLGKRQPERGLQLQDGVFGFMLIWLVIGFVGILGSLANMAHLCGLIIGLLHGWLDSRRRA